MVFESLAGIHATGFAATSSAVGAVVGSALAVGDAVAAGERGAHGLIDPESSTTTVSSSVVSGLMNREPRVLVVRSLMTGEMCRGTVEKLPLAERPGTGEASRLINGMQVEGHSGERYRSPLQGEGVLIKVLIGGEKRKLEVLLGVGACCRWRCARVCCAPSTCCFPLLWVPSPGRWSRWM